MTAPAALASRPWGAAAFAEWFEQVGGAGSAGSHLDSFNTGKTVQDVFAEESRP